MTAPVLQSTVRLSRGESLFARRSNGSAESSLNLASRVSSGYGRHQPESAAAAPTRQPKFHHQHTKPSAQAQAPLNAQESWWRGWSPAEAQSTWRPVHRRRMAVPMDEPVPLPAETATESRPLYCMAENTFGEVRRRAPQRHKSSLTASHFSAYSGPMVDNSSPSTPRANQRRHRRFPPHMLQSQLVQPQGLTPAVFSSLNRQGRRLLGGIVDGASKCKNKKTWSPRKSLSDYFTEKPAILPPGLLAKKIAAVAIPVVVVLIGGAIVLRQTVHSTTSSRSKPPSTSRSSQSSRFLVNQRRHLKDRKCVMNMFIEKQPEDEYDPDFMLTTGEETDDDDTKEKEGENSESIQISRGPKLADGSNHRTEETMKVLQRFIASVSYAFRPKSKLKQHIVFAGTRDTGHLGEQVLRHWPPRSHHQTQLHIVVTNSTDDTNDDKKGQNTKSSDNQEHRNGRRRLHEETASRFLGKENTNIYDSDGTPVLYKGQYHHRFWRPAVGSTIHSQQPHSTIKVSEIVPFEEDDDVVIPYLHVDGLHGQDQLKTLRTFKPVLRNHRAVVVVVENTPDMNVEELIEFFHSVNYKTFFLGKRQLARVDNICPEILQEVMSHPHVNPRNTVAPKQSFFRRVCAFSGICHSQANEDNQLQQASYPPYFVAMPRGRRNQEETTIQHMYDLFGGFGSGQVATANDRAVPGKE